MAKAKNVGQVQRVEINNLMITNAIRIYSHWKQLDAEVRSISTRGVNFPSELSEQFGCYVLGYLWNKENAGDAYDPVNNRIIEMKGSGSDEDDLSSFSPDECFDELVFLKVRKNEDSIYIYETGINSDGLKKIKVNSTQTVEDQQRQGRRPRFSVEKQIIKANGIKPTYKLDILNKKIIKL